MGLASNQVLGDGQQIGGGGMEKNQLQQQSMPRLRCPRCDSNNTKFCYYNNYSRAQPRHYCRACRRHWTEGGTLRNVPVGGGRKSKHPKTTTTTTTGTMIQQAAAPPADGELDSGILSNIFRSVLFYPPVATSDHVGGLISSPAVISNDVGGVIDPLPISNSSSSSSSPPYSNQTTQDSVPGDALLTLMPGSEASTWLQDPPPLPASYCWTWWDETADFVSAGIEHHPVIAPQYP